MRAEEIARLTDTILFSQTDPGISSLLLSQSSSDSHVSACNCVAINLAGILASSVHYSQPESPARRFPAAFRALRGTFLSASCECKRRKTFCSYFEERNGKCMCHEQPAVVTLQTRPRLRSLPLLLFPNQYQRAHLF